MPDISTSINILTFLVQILLFIGSGVYAINKFKFSIEGLQKTVDDLGESIEKVKDKFDDIIETQHMHTAQIHVIQRDIDRLENIRTTDKNVKQ